MRLPCPNPDCEDNVVEQLRQLTTLPSRAAIAAIVRYQRIRSGDEPPAPIPANSGPAVLVETIARHGLIVGGIKGCWRVVYRRQTQDAAIS